jgi:hypothetical protein
MTAASAALKEQGALADRLAPALKSIGAGPDAPKLLETTFMPLLDRYLSALDTAIARSDEALAIRPDQDIAAAVETLRRRSKSFHAARDQLASVREHPERLEEVLKATSASLLLTP